VSSSLSSSSGAPTAKKSHENVLILQGGGSLGAFGCGVFKALVNNNIKIDVAAGTSIGGINAAVIAGSKDEKHPQQALEQFWLELSEGFMDLDKVPLAFPSPLPRFIEDKLLPSDHFYHLPADSLDKRRNYLASTVNANERSIKMKQLKSFYSSAFFGNDKMFKPRWKKGNILTDPEHFSPQKWTYIYDHSPLVQTLEKYIDYDKLN
jgi:NTE family protein